MKVRKAGLGKNNEFTKRLNRQTVLDLLRREPAQSRADLARLTRLSPQSLSNIIDDLERAGLIERTGKVRFQHFLDVLADAQRRHRLKVWMSLQEDDARNQLISFQETGLGSAASTWVFFVIALVAILIIGTMRLDRAAGK